MERIGRGTTPESGLVLQKRLDGGDGWSIHRTFVGSRVLIATAARIAHWKRERLIPAEMFRPMPQEGGLCYAVSPCGKRLECVAHADTPTSVGDALSFAAALRESRKCTTVHFGDAIFFEQYSRLLPLPDGRELSDDIVLGCWLTGGAAVSACDIERIHPLMTWTSEDAIRDIARHAGLDLPAMETVEEVAESAAADADVPQEEFILYGREELTRFFRDYIIDIVRRPAEYARMGIDFPGAVLLYGPPGSGKTYAVEQLAAYLGWSTHIVNAASIGSKYIHETSRKIAELFEEAAADAPSIVVIDEMEAFLAARDGSTHQHHTEEVGEFLRLLQTARRQRILVLGMTNRIDDIDPAARRKGRFDHIIEVGLPSEEEICALLQKKLAGIPCTADVSPAHIAAHLVGCSMADAAYLVQEAGRRAVRTGSSAVTQEILSAVVAEMGVPPEKRPIGFHVGSRD